LPEKARDRNANIKTQRLSETLLPSASANPWQISLVADYSLSKRTDLYLTTAYSKNAGLNFDTSIIGFAHGYFAGKGQTSMLGLAVGIRHKV